MVLRRATAILVTSLGALALAGCSVPITGSAGLRVEGGRVRAVVQMCPGFTANQVDLEKATRSNFFWETTTTTWRFDSAAYAPVDLGTLNEFIDLVGDRRMVISSNASGGIGGSVVFEAADVRQLLEGEILSHSWSERDLRVFDAVSFENEALAYCPGI